MGKMSEGKRYVDSNDDSVNGSVDSIDDFVDHPGADDSVTDPVDVIICICLWLLLLSVFVSDFFR